MKKIVTLILSAVLTAALTVSAAAADLSHTVAPGDTMWKLAVKYRVGTSEIIAANPQVANPNLIYPGQRLRIPQVADAVLSCEAEVVRLVNALRAEKGLQPLTANWELSRVARYKSEDMVRSGYFSHTSPTYGTPFQMMKSFGISYRTAGENIAYGQRTPAAVMEAWMNSSGHRANILSASYTQIGVALCGMEHGIRPVPLRPGPPADTGGWSPGSPRPAPAPPGPERARPGSSPQKIREIPTG